VVFHSLRWFDQFGVDFALPFLLEAFGNYMVVFWYRLGTIGGQDMEKKGRK
jgi:hypothetical protein